MPKRDATKPTVTYSIHPDTYTVDQAASITWAANDLVSGIESTTCAEIAGDAYAFHPGVNTYSATARDRAGNVGAASTSFTVSPTATGICALAHRWVTGGNAEDL